MMFVPTVSEQLIDVESDVVEIPKTDEVMTTSGWKFAKELQPNDILVCDDDGELSVRAISQKNNSVFVSVMNGGGSPV